MKKKISKAIRYYGKPATIICNIEDVNGCISITGEIWRKGRSDCECCGCIHEEISKYFPKLRPYLWLHLKDTTTHTDHYFIENSLHHLMNGRADIAQKMFHATDEEMFEIVAFVNFGLYKGGFQKWGFYSASKNTQEVFARGIAKYNFPERCKAAMQEFYKLVETM